MHDIRMVRADPAGFDAALARRGAPPMAAELLCLDEARRGAIAAAEAAQAARKARSREVGALKAAGRHDDAEALIAALNASDHVSGEEQDRAEAALRAVLETLPNRLDPEVPDGADESANLVLHQHGVPPDLDFAPKQHFEIGEALGLMDFAAATKLSGSRFTVLRGALARLERALGQWMLDRHVRENGFEEVSPPLLVRDEALYGTGQLPKFREDLFHVPATGHSLIPTAEVPLTNLVAGEILAEADLPRRFAALTPCFRSEAGSAGRDTRGMLRQHQFQKAEMVAVTRLEDSAAEHERMTRCAEAVLTDLGLVWRRVLLCAGDTGFSAAKTFDLEVWLPGQGAWREISSCSNTRDFQARRMNARYRPAGGKGTAFPHTLNGSGVAVGRALIAVLETHQQADGTVLVPEPLRAAMGTDRIGPSRAASGHVAVAHVASAAQQP